MSIGGVLPKGVVCGFGRCIEEREELEWQLCDLLGSCAYVLKGSLQSCR